MPSEKGFHRLVSFSDAVVAIAITLLVLPLVDAARSVGSTGTGRFLTDNRYQLFAFALSFVVIGNFWWAQHQTFERARSYNAVLVWGMFFWLFSIVFLPFPTELLSSARRSGTATHAIYIGTMLVTSWAAFIQQWAIVRWPELQQEAHRGTATIDDALVPAVLMAVALVVTVLVPSVGLWSLLVLLLTRPLVGLLSVRRRRRTAA